MAKYCLLNSLIQGHQSTSIRALRLGRLRPGKLNTIASISTSPKGNEEQDGSRHQNALNQLALSSYFFAFSVKTIASLLINYCNAQSIDARVTRGICAIIGVGGPAGNSS